jgi:protein-disulfide isomerase
MRLTCMNNLRRLSAAFALTLGLVFAAAPATAQRAVPPGTGQTFKDTSMIKPPAGARIAIYEFEDLECPACGRAHPMVMAAIDHYKIPFVRKDFPLQGHIWSTDAAIWARYLQDKVAPKVADEYRTAVFAAQAGIGSKDDLMNFTRKFFQSHGAQMPFVVDPTGELRKEVFADRDLGMKMGLSQTPTIFVCTQTSWVQVTDPTQLYQTIESVQAGLGPAGPTIKKASK